MLIAVVFSALCIWVRAATFTIISEKIALQLRFDLFYFLINKDISFFDEMKTGDILSRMSSDTAVVQDGLSTNISIFVRSSIFIIATLVVLAYLSWKLTLVTIVAVLPISFFAVYYGRVMKEYSIEIQSKKGELG